MVVLAVGLAVRSHDSSAQELAPASPPAFKLIEASRPSQPASPPQVLAPLGGPGDDTTRRIPEGSKTSAPPAPVSSGAQAAPALTLQKIGPSSVRPRQPFTYEIVVRNVGAAPASQVMVEDVLPPETQLMGASPRAEVQGNRLGWGLGNLKPGAERHCTVEVQLERGLKELPPATLSYSVGCALPAAPLEAVEAPLKAEAAPLKAESVPTPQSVSVSPLSVAVAGPGQVKVGDRTVFQIEISNNGYWPMTGILLRTILPPGLKHPQGTDIEADVAQLAPGQTRRINLMTTAVKPGRQVSQTMVSADGNLEAKASAEVMVTEVMNSEGTGGIVRTSATQVPVLNVEVQNRESLVEAGSETTYQIRVVNQGTGIGTGVQIQTLLDEGMVPRSADGPTPFNVVGKQVMFEPLARLDPGHEALYRVRVICGRVGDWRFKVQLSSDQLRLPVCKEEIMRVYNDR
jgi:uncharacterized repeat protein (TIGR01451 family)